MIHILAPFQGAPVNRAEKRREVVTALLADGSELCSHTYTARGYERDEPAPGLSDGEKEDELFIVTDLNQGEGMRQMESFLR